MTILSFLLQLMSGAMLLLFSVRFMRIGIERLWSAQIRSSLNEQSTILQNLLKGTGLGFLMQGATVVMLMAAGLAGAGTIPIVSASIVALGADMGSALAVQFLQLPISALGPAAVLAGATLYLRVNQPRLRNFGRVLLGLGLIFLSLTIIRAAVAPLGNVPGTLAVVDYLNRDPITAALVGAALTLLMHSSVAAILTAVAFSSHTTLGPSAGLAFMIGCNLGSSLLPIWLLKYENQRGKLVAMSVAGIRSSAALVIILLLVVVGSEINAKSPFSTVGLILVGHIGFNFFLMFLAPFCARLAEIGERRWVTEESEMNIAFPAGAMEDASLALSLLKRQLNGMLETASAMLEEVTSEVPDRVKMAELERRMNDSLAGLRQAYAKLPEDDEGRLLDIQQIVEFAIRVERCGDVFADKYLDLRMNQLQGDYTFSSEGEMEITELVEAVRRAIIMAQETAWTSDIASAQRLVRHKQKVTEMESRSRSQHLTRLRRGNLVSLESSDQHLEIVAALKEINSKFATIGYAVLERHGGLKKTRLKSSVSASTT